MDEKRHRKILRLIKRSQKIHREGQKSNSFEVRLQVTHSVIDLAEQIRDLVAVSIEESEEIIEKSKKDFLANQD